MRRVVIVNDKMQQGYRYELSASVGRKFEPQFRPDLTPKQMLELGVFCGKYLTDCRDEYPASWYASAKLRPPAAAQRGRRPDRALQGDEAPCVANQETLRAGRSDVPTAPAPSDLALGL